MKKILLTISLFVFIIMISGGLYFGSKIFLPLQLGEFDEPVEIKIRNGMSVTSIADSLEKYEIVESAEDFILTTKIFNNVSKLKAGKYNLKKGLSPFQAMKIIVAGKTSGSKVVIPEGLTSYQIASILSKRLEIDSTTIINFVHDPKISSSFNLHANSLEGYLFPNTYFFQWGISEDDVIQILLNEFKRNFPDSLKNIVLEKGWTVHQIVTLASIIEGEAIVDSERAVISAVYHNRLKRGILLQADPTIQYIIPDGPRRLLHRDLTIDSPYNTYRYAGLPPGPVNNPGLKSILAAIYPAENDFIYFVAKGDGTHIFSRTLREHNAAKAKFDAYRRMVNRAKRLKGQ